MLRRTSLVALLAAGAFAGSAHASTPAQIYNDYVRSGKLHCGYSRGDLQGVLRSGSINQYGDPLTLTRLKLAARRQLAGSCTASGHSAGAQGGSSSSGGGTSSRIQTTPKHHGKAAPKRRGSAPRTGVSQMSSAGNGSFVVGRVLIFAALAAALAFAGWLTKRGLSTRD